ncbi:Stage IV sporulation protein H [Thiorhodovibrio winogradskyi]|uniref:Stage IV sporulation protein H n=1 Tax=Thiorhodovibrio winogradskyi TaxID=77007 RepID=A0ABZ0SCA8_9GAMM|nr:redoxin domain-containing protein [Thiorhodovibrio winogradskyi]
MMRADKSTDKDRRSARWRPWAVDLVIVLAVVGLVQWWQARPLATGMAPPLAGVEVVSGDRLDLANLRGKPVLVHFWGTWCPVCRLMDGTIARIAEDHTLVSVAMYSGSADEVSAYLDENDHVFPVVLDPNGQMAGRWGVVGVPASFIIDADGRIRFATRGVRSGPGLRLRLWLVGFSTG